MDLQFTKQGDKYVAEFSATSDFNLHLEKPQGGDVKFFQSSVEGAKPAPIRGVKFYKFDLFLDEDFTSLVYPKYIRIESEVEPTMAVVTFAE